MLQTSVWIIIIQQKLELHTLDECISRVSITNSTLFIKRHFKAQNLSKSLIFCIFLYHLFLYHPSFYGYPSDFHINVTSSCACAQFVNNSEATSFHFRTNFDHEVDSPPLPSLSLHRPQLQCDCQGAADSAEAGIKTFI